MAGTRYGDGANTVTSTEESRERARAAQTMAGLERVGVVASLTPTSQTVAVTETNWPPMALSLLRGALEGFVLAGLDLMTALSLDFSTRDSFVSAGVIFFGRLAIALGVGGVDQWNAAKERHR